MLNADPRSDGSPADPATFSPRGFARRYAIALALPILAICTASLIPAAVDTYRLLTRESALPWYQVLHGAIFIVALISMIALPLGILEGLLLCVLIRDQDLAEWAGAKTHALCNKIQRWSNTPEGGAGIYAFAAGFGLFSFCAYQLNHLFFATFKNQQLAALLLVFIILALMILSILGGVVLWVLIQRLTRIAVRVIGLRLFARAPGALVLVLCTLLAVVIYFLVEYAPIVRMIDWRFLSYPGLTLGGGLLLLAALVWVRLRRLSRHRQTSHLRRAAFVVWFMIFISLWIYCLARLGDHPSVRTAILGRSFGAARSYDLITRALDFDSDGYLSFFGGGDCAPFDQDVHPGAMEIPDNNIDDNCFGGDLLTKKSKRHKQRFEEKLPASFTAKGRPNIVLLTLDGLRADHIGAYGYLKKTTPNLDKLALSSVRFERAIAHGPSTRYSIPSFLTSKYFLQVPHSEGNTIPEPILDEALLMAEIFKQAGYRTGAALSYHVFDRSWNVDQGFDFYDTSQAAYYHGKGTPTWNKDRPYVLIAAAKKFLDQKSTKPYFLWIHFFEPHPPYVRRTDPIDFGTDIVGLYDGELRFADQKVQEFLDLLNSRPDRNRTVIAFSSDHGRGFGEHGIASHGYDLYNEVLHVPLIFQVPGIKPRVIKNPVGLIDLLPTLVNLARIREPFDFEGHSLVPQIVSGKEPDPKRPIFSWVQVGFQDSHVINAITTRDYKLIYDVSFNTYQLYDALKDPVEKYDISKKQPRVLKEMMGLINQVVEHATLPMIQEEIYSNVLNQAPVFPQIKKVNFGNEIEFLGFEVFPKHPKAGAIISINWFARTLKKTRNDNKFVVILKGNRGGYFNAKHVPVRGLFPTTKWPLGKVIRDRQHMQLPQPPQTWQVWVGFGAGHDTLTPQIPPETPKPQIPPGTPKPQIPFRMKKLELKKTEVNVGEFTTY